MLEIKNNQTELNNAFDRLISRLDIAKKIMLEALSTEIYKVEMKRPKKKNEEENMQLNIQERGHNYKRCNISDKRLISI